MPGWCLGRSGASGEVFADMQGSLDLPWAVMLEKLSLGAEFPSCPCDVTSSAASVGFALQDQLRDGGPASDP